MNEDLPPNDTDRKVKMLKYYQWTPFILLFQALLFYLPRMIWRSLSDKSGLDLQSLVDVVHNYELKGAAPPQSKKDTLLQYLANTFDQYLNTARNTRLKNDIPNYEFKYTENLLQRKKSRVESSNESENTIESIDDGFYSSADEKRKISHIGKLFCITKGKRYGNYLLVLFVFVKVLFCVNSIVQLFILNHFLGNNFLVLGWEVLVKIWTGEDWTQLSRFPRVTMCDFSIREVGIVHRYTVQCVLSINLFNEKIFIFIWYWLFIVSLFNIFDLASWLYTLKLNSSNRYCYIKRKLKSIKSSYLDDLKSGSRYEERMVAKFVDHYLQEDGVLALRLLSRNVHDLIVSQVVSQLYNSFRVQEQEKESRMLKRPEQAPHGDKLNEIDETKRP